VVPGIAVPSSAPVSPGSPVRAIDYFERREIPFIVALNVFDGSRLYDPEDVRIALDLDPGLPIIWRAARASSGAGLSGRLVTAGVSHQAEGTGSSRSPPPAGWAGALTTSSSSPGP
jgi:uncharacterized protein